jgi:hypothetical protein
MYRLPAKMKRQPFSDKNKEGNEHINITLRQLRTTIDAVDKQ